MSFTEQLSNEALAYFNNVCQQTYAQQGVAFLNAYWPEIHDQADFIFNVSWEKIKYADMHAKGIQYLHQYEEGNDLDFDIGLYFYEILCKFVEDDNAQSAPWRTEQFARSQPEMMTAIQRKKELREKVDVNYDGRITFLEYLLYQYRDVANPADFCQRSMSQGEEHPEIRRARLALEEVNRRIRAYEAEKARLEEESKMPGVRGLRATNELAQLGSSPLWEELNAALITAEAAVRIATRRFGGQSGAAGGEGGNFQSTDGAIYWMNKDLEDKQRRYGGRK